MTLDIKLKSPPRLKALAPAQGCLWKTTLAAVERELPPKPEIPHFRGSGWSAKRAICLLYWQAAAIARSR